MNDKNELKDIRGWWGPGVLNFIVISFIVYCLHRDYYNGWSLWWRVIVVSCLFGGGLVMCFYDGKTSTPGYYENIKRRIKIFWAVTLFWFLLLSFSPIINFSDESIDPGEWSRP